MEIDNRELLRQVMEIKEKIRDLSKEEQKEILTNKIAEVRRCLTIIPMSFEKYELSSRQREVERLSLLESNVETEIDTADVRVCIPRIIRFGIEAIIRGQHERSLNLGVKPDIGGPSACP